MVGNEGSQATCNSASRKQSASEAFCLESSNVEKWHLIMMIKVCVHMGVFVSLPFNG